MYIYTCMYMYIYLHYVCSHSQHRWYPLPQSLELVVVVSLLKALFLSLKPLENLIPVRASP